MGVNFLFFLVELGWNDPSVKYEMSAELQVRSQEELINIILEQNPFFFDFTT
jgi:hypothetical protein